MKSVRNPHRSGAAAVEAAIVLSVLFPILFGVWELSRLVHVQQIVSNGVREGCRVAAQAVTIREDGTQIQILTAVDPPAAGVVGTPNVKASVVQTLYGAGLTNLRWADVTVTFAFTNSPTGAVLNATQPYQGIKNQRFRVSVSIPYEKVQWTNLGIVNPSTVSYSAEWSMLVDDQFSLNTTIPAVNPQ